MFALIVCFGLLGTLPEAEVRGSDAEVTFTVASESHPVLADAMTESHSQLHALVWQWLKDNSSALPPESQDLLPMWLQSATSRRSDTSEAIDRAYGRLHQHRVSVSVARSRLAAFSIDASQAIQSRNQQMLRQFAAGFVILAATWSLAAFLDRWTRGYRRRPIVAAACAASLLLGAGAFQFL